MKNPNQYINTSKSQVTTEINAVDFGEKKDQCERNKNIAGTNSNKKTLVKLILTITIKTPIIVLITSQTTEMTENQELSTHPVRPVAKRTTPHRNDVLEPMQKMEHLLGTEDRWDMGRSRNQLQDTQNTMTEIDQAVVQTLTYTYKMFTPVMHMTDRRQTQRRNFYQFPLLFGNNPQRHLLTITS